MFEAVYESLSGWLPLSSPLVGPFLPLTPSSPLVGYMSPTTIYAPVYVFVCGSGLLTPAPDSLFNYPLLRVVAFL